jgi:hypothetical protein
MHFKNSVLRKIFGHEAGENCLMRSFIISTFYQMLLGKLNQGLCNVAHMGDTINVYIILVRKHEGNKLL